MSWIRIDDNAPQHQKMLTAGPVACWLWVCGLAYCQRQKTDGFIPTVALQTFGVRDWEISAEVLVSVGLWHTVTGGYQVHDYLDYNGSAEEREAQAERHRQRSVRHRNKKRDASPTKLSDDNVTRHSLGSVTLLPSPPLHSPPLHSSPTTTMSSSRASSSSSAPLLMSPIQYDNLIQKNAFIGARLRVPNVLHGELRNKLGGENPDTRLQTWYLALDEEAERTKEPILDVFTWLRPKFLTFARHAAREAAKQAFLQRTGGARGQ